MEPTRKGLIKITILHLGWQIGFAIGVQFISCSFVVIKDAQLNVPVRALTPCKVKTQLPASKAPLGAQFVECGKHNCSTQPNTKRKHVKGSVLTVLENFYKDILLKLKLQECRKLTVWHPLSYVYLPNNWGPQTKTLLQCWEYLGRSATVYSLRYLKIRKIL